MIGRIWFLPALLLLALPASVLAHSDHREELISFEALHWSFDPWVIVPLAVSGWLYLQGLVRLWRSAGRGGGIRTWEASCFAAGWLMLIVALVSPLDPFGEALFSAHMVQHELLMLVAAPLMVLGRPLAVFVWAFPPRWRGTIGGAAKWMPWDVFWRFITHPLAAWWIHALVLWIWHVPPFFQASILDSTVHSWQHFSFLFAALLFWWSLFHGRARHGGPGVAILYLLTTAMHTGVLGALLTFSERVWYPVYAPLTPAWGLTPLEDQQLGGLIMWVPGGLAYLVAALWLAARLLGEGDARAVERVREP